MHATVRSAALVGVDAIEVRVEASLAGGLPAVHVVGLPDAAVREARERVRAALRSCDVSLPPSRVVVNLAPADIRKEGPGFDLPIALALLAAQARLPQQALRATMAIGELGLDGSVRPVRGIVAIALRARASNCSRLLLPAAQAAEAACVPGVAVVPVASLAEAMAWCRGDGRARPPATAPPATALSAPDDPSPDLADVVGQAVAKRALEIAAAGGHHLLLAGPPGGGKSMLARGLAGILPPLDEPAALEVARLHSVAGLPRAPSDRRPPFRDPHHASSLAGLLGSERGPGELSLAQHGVLFLDELPEFDRRVLEALRQPLERGALVLARSRGRLVLPADFQLVAAMNPCPCGFDGDDETACHCHPTDRRRYALRLSGPLLDRFDLRVRVPRTAEGADDGACDGAHEPSAAVARRVAASRARARARSDLRRRSARRDTGADVTLDPAGRAVLEELRRRGAIGERGAAALMRVARTIADLSGTPHVAGEHVAEALAFRSDPRADGATVLA